MKIAMVSEHASPLAALGEPDAGGQNVYVKRLSETLAARGHEITVHTRRDSPHLPERAPLADGATVAHVTAGPARPIPKDELLGHMKEFSQQLARAWHEDPPDVVHAHFWMSGMAALPATHGTGIPLVQTFHALGSVKRREQGAGDSSPDERVRVESHLGRAASDIVATCSDEETELVRMGVPRSQVTVVPCGVDAHRFRPGVTDTPGRVPPLRARHRLLAVGRLVPRKGFDQAVRAMAVLPSAELLIVGGPPAARLDDDAEARRLRELAKEYGVEDRVRLLGGLPHEELPALLQSADLVLCTAWYEPFGIVPVEAMACGVPVVATRVGGYLDTVQDQQTGIHLPSHGPFALGTTVRRLLAQPGLRRELGAAGRARVLERYTWDRVADGVEEVYVKAVARAGTGTPRLQPLGPPPGIRPVSRPVTGAA
ncbi:glycosyltransferase [Streptomyces iconiensis]|uniref:D-inositol 3-phosphate glycosyltransferase n=1 Tax=Streptomyces iconiensis TaxID=1384038 RepID=A0ABT6ZUT1_9ACTN|nr:glycosyltransferase [Streptomyces iconiensis]MDJ1132829.1 glycosyltransferase [Streptomyces iconiensis]